MINVREKAEVAENGKILGSMSSMGHEQVLFYAFFQISRIFQV